MKVTKENSNNRARQIIKSRAMAKCFPFLFKDKQEQVEPVTKLSIKEPVEV